MRATERAVPPNEAHRLTDAAPALIWSTDSDGGVTYFNRRWSEYSGLRVEELREQGLFSIVHPEDAPRARALWHDAGNGSRPFETEYRLRAADGVYRWHVARAEPLRDPSGSLVGWIGVCSNVDEQRRSAQYLKFLSDAGDVLASAVDVRETLQSVARLAVPTIAECCAVYVRGESGRLEPAAIAHDDPEKVRLAYRFAEEYGIGEDDAARVLERGESVLVERVASSALAGGARDERHLQLLLALDVASVIVVPLLSRGTVFGILQFVSGRGARSLTGADLSLAQDLAKRAGAAIDNALLLESRERGVGRLRFLAEVGETLSDSLDLSTRLTKLVQFVVPRMATWAAVNLVNDDGHIETVAIAHRDPAMSAAIERLRGPYYGRERAARGTPEVIRSGRATLLSAIDDRFLADAMRPETIDTIRELGTHSAIVVPLSAHGHMQGTLAAVRSPSDQQFTENDIPLFEEIARRASVAIENAQLFARQRAVADTFQKASLPATLPAAARFTFDGFYEPGRSEALIGGDWYDAFVLEDGRIVVSIGDVAGNGLGAAVIMGSVRQVIRGAAHIDADPGVILDATDRALQGEHPDRIVTAFVGVLGPGDQTLTFASAGHPPPVVRRAAGNVEELLCVGLPLGLRGRDHQAAAVVGLAAGDVVVLYTDGLTESTRDLAEGERRLHAAIGSEEVLQAPDLARAIFEHVLYDGSSDDVAILTIAVRDAEAAAGDGLLRRRFQTSDEAAAARTLRDIAARLRELGATEAECESAALVFLELIGNAVRHAPGGLEVVLDAAARPPVLHVFDTGPGFEHAGSRGPSEPLIEGGRGLFLVSQNSREFRIRRRLLGGSHARAVLSLRGEPG